MTFLLDLLISSLQRNTGEFCDFTLLGIVHYYTRGQGARPVRCVWCARSLFRDLTS